MRKRAALLFCLSIAIGNWSCIVEDLGRKVSPGYNDYMRNRTIEQVREDRRRQEEVEKEQRKRSVSENGMKQFEEKIKLESAKNRDTAATRE